MPERSAKASLKYHARHSAILFHLFIVRYERCSEYIGSVFVKVYCAALEDC